MTESKAWREIARRIVEGKWVQLGLCCEVSWLQSAREITPETKAAMYKRVADHAVFSESCQYRYAYPKGEEPEARALAALWLALEAEEDGA